ncbi:enoyl-CoA hydratase/isomerase family protein [bacterium]|nr:enoyl-CoA hydratase/isomerase family protein [bacterium]
MSGNEVTWEKDGPVAWMTINRPEARNAMNRAVREGLWEGFRRFAADGDAAVLVLTGAGDEVFSAGGDLKEMAELKLEVPPPDYAPYLGRNIEMPKPVIAAVNGLAWAGGFLLAQMCDLCIAADHATFGITEARWGRGAPWAAPLPWLVPPRVALELLMTADPIDARRAYEVGLVNRVVPRADLRPATQAMALRIAGNAPLSVRAGKALVYAAAELGWHEALDEGDRLFEPVYRSQDAQEGPRAFREKRKPRWSGR